jgi:hypothetical protein
MLTLEIDSAASIEGREKLTYFVYFPWPPLEARLSIRHFVSYLLVLGSLYLHVAYERFIFERIYTASSISRLLYLMFIMTTIL